MSTLKEIANALCEYKRAKSDVARTKKEVLRLAIEHGLPNGNPNDARVFLDGYLVGQGMREAWREVEEPTEETFEMPEII